MKRERGYAAAAAVVGAGAAALAVSRGWFQATGPREQGSFETTTDLVAGSERYPWLWALALASLSLGLSLAGRLPDARELRADELRCGGAAERSWKDGVKTAPRGEP